jgi:NADP-dependent 3-hydroxy acid dehydrogenase YdfG
MKTLKDKVIMITGAGGTIAGAVESAFRSEGARLALVDKEKVRILGRANSYRALALEADFSSLENARNVVAEVKRDMGRLDGLIHLVGEIVTADVVDASEEDYEVVFDTNVRTLFHAVKAVLPVLLEQESGMIAGIASQEAWGGSAAGSSLFAAAKSAVATFLRSLDAELVDSAVSVAIAFPMGRVDTLSNRRMFQAESPHFIHPDAIARALVAAALAGEEGSLLELPIHPPRRQQVRAS